MKKVSESFEYNPEDGTLFWKRTGRNSHLPPTTPAGRPVTNPRTGKTYRVFRFNKRTAMAHRIAWEIVNGPIPKGMQVDHINGDGTDNRLDNLRLVFPYQNQRNMRRRADNTSKVNGVTWHSQRKKWAAQAHMFGKHIHLGLFETLEEAAAARKAFDRKQDFATNHGLDRPL